jgi:hypothetical protein
MHQLLNQISEEATARMDVAAENLKRIMRELAPYERKTVVEELSTAGTWRASEDHVLISAATSATMWSDIEGSRFGNAAAPTDAVYR